MDSLSTHSAGGVPILMEYDWTASFFSESDGTLSILKQCLTNIFGRVTVTEHPASYDNGH